MAATPTSPFLRTSEHERAKEKDKKKKEKNLSAPKEKDPSSYRSELFRAGWRPTREVVVVADEREVEARPPVVPFSSRAPALVLAGVAPRRVVVVATRSVEAIKSAVRFGRPVTLIPRWKSGPTHHRNLKTRDRSADRKTP